MSKYTSVTKHINTLKTLFSQLLAIGHNIEEKECVELLLESLPDSYDHLIMNLANGVLRTMIVFNDVVAIVLEEESRHKNKEDKMSSQQNETLIISRGRSTDCGSSGSKQNKSKSQGKKKVKCYHYGK